MENNFNATLAKIHKKNYKSFFKNLNEVSVFLKNIFFIYKCIKIIFFIFLNLFLISIHQNYKKT